MNARALILRRLDLGRTQQELAAEIGISQPTLSRYEAARLPIPAEVAKRVGELKPRVSYTRGPARFTARMKARAVAHISAAPYSWEGK